MPAIYDTSKFYKSELKKTDTMESLQPDNDELQDSDDEEDLSALPTRSNYTIQVRGEQILDECENFVNVSFCKQCTPNLQQI